MKVANHDAKHRSVMLGTTFAVYYGKVSGWGHRAWDNALVVYGDNSFRWILEHADHATFYEWQAPIDALRSLTEAEHPAHMIRVVACYATYVKENHDT